MMSKKIVLLLIIILIIMILVIGGYLALMMVNKKPLVTNENANIINQQVTGNTNGNSVNNNNGSPTNGTANIIPEAENVKKGDKESITSLVNVFAQNYGSYNNQLGFVNFDNIKDYMTAKMKEWVLETYTNEISSKHPTSEYYAVETKVLNINISAFDEEKNTAEVRVSTQREEFKKDSVTSNTFTQELLLNLVKENDVWKVSGAYWQ
ncbi:MAG: hypothetical protein NTZ49_02690 [Candidatus Parcubacteria bacterium]|nr:hypothetical protein [Candidatus Parcubacteria bacterium]